MEKLLIAQEADRIAVVTALARNGYCVRMGKEKTPGKNSYSFYVYIVEEPAQMIKTVKEG